MGAETRLFVHEHSSYVQQIQWLSFDKQIDEWIFAFAIVGADSNFEIRQDI